MGGVNLVDMLSALYRYSFKRRWYLVYSWWYTVMSHWHSSALGCCIHEGIEATEKYYVTENVASVVSCLISA